MCNLYSMTKAQDAMRSLFKVDADRDRLGNMQPFPAIWPKYDAPIVRLADDGERELVMMKWGFLTPNVSKKTGKPLSPAAWNNARDDKVSTNGLWKNSFLNRRCLIPATSFREAKGRNPATDYWFTLKSEDERPLFAFAGMWRGYQVGLPEDQAEQLTHTMITTSANEIVKPIHPTRMPVILSYQDNDQWMNGSETDALALLRQYPAHLMRLCASGVGKLKDE